MVGALLAVAMQPRHSVSDRSGAPDQPAVDSVTQLGIAPAFETANARLRRLLPSLPASATAMRHADRPKLTPRPLRQARRGNHIGIYGERPSGFRPVAIVLHGTGSGRTASEFKSSEALARYFQRKGIAASHYAIDRRGRITQFVSDDRAAFHVATPGWNDISIGIELLNDNSGKQPFPSAQIRATQQLVRYLGARYAIPVEAVVRHRDVQPADRSDPARNFPWTAFRASLRATT